MGILLNILLRVAIFYFLAEVMLLPDDPRFAGKAIPIRNLIIVVTLSLVFPFLFFLRKKWKSYPVWFDNLYLSIFALDMAGNSFNLYDSYFYFDLIPHFHGTGAIALALTKLLPISLLSSLGLANMIHLGLEAQEYYTDIIFKTHNVRGTFDVVNDMTIGILGAALYCAIFLLLKRFYR